MKNKILVFATIAFVSLATFASTNTSTNNRYYNNYGDSFTFVEQGITFSVFQNGEFDFYINPRNDIHVGYQGNGVNISFNSGYNYDAYVQYDNYGAIIQIEAIPIYYDYYGRVNRIGNINLNYQYGKLARLGGLHVYYDNYGSYSYCSGYINVYNRNYVYHPYHNFFSRPFFEYRVVSYTPYRNHYKPVRYTYNRNHSRNTYYNKSKYYSNNNKNTRNNTRQRVATQNVPKRANDNIARVDRNNENLNRKNRTNRSTRNSTNSNSTKRNTTAISTNRNRVAIKRAPEKSVQQKRTATNNKSIRIQEKRTTTNSGWKPSSSNERKSTRTTKNKIKKENSSNENTRKRRS